MSREQHLIIGNLRSRFPLWVLFRAVAMVVLWLPLLGGAAGAVFYGAMQDTLPSSPDILAPPPGSATEVVTRDGRPIGGLARGLAPWTPYDDIPPLVVQAFLAAEDDDFFLHGGMDLRAITRAALANLQSGGIRQGGSTITQQVAKMFVGQSRTYERKLVELLTARRIEAVYSKEDILEAYLNRIYLGAGAQGVRAASRIYFDHSLGGLTLAEVATLAGVASAPTRFEPYDHPDRALTRRDLVLGRMESLGFVAAAAASAARAEPMVLRERGEIPEPPLPYLTDQIRQDILRDHGRNTWRYGALQVTAATSLTMQRQAEDAMHRGLEEIDRRQGYRGPLRRATSLRPAGFEALVREHVSPHQRFRPALVEAVGDTEFSVWVDGDVLSVPPEGWRWASEYDDQSDENEVERETLDGLVAPGDVVLVEKLDDDTLRLAQLPRLEGAIAAMDLETGYLAAMVGGADYDRSQFNRATRGCRQPGSVFKPVVFSVALDRGMTLATPLIDVPMQLPQGSGIEIWRPRNADGNYQGDLLFRDALIRSRNLPTIRVFKRVGILAALERAATLGFTTEMHAVDSLSLGASCVYPVDVATAYGVFANRGHRQRPVAVVSVIDGRGLLVADEGAFFDGTAHPMAAIHRAFRELANPRRPLIDPRNAYLITSVLRDVVRMGTGYRAAELDFPAAGKTGTTNAYDAWFAGYSERLVASVWVGSDRNTRALGRGEHGAEVALPIWIDFMAESLAGLEQGSLTEPRPPGVSLIKVDLLTGDLAQEGAPGVWLPFREGTEPEDYAPTPEQRDLENLDRVDWDF